MCAVCFNFNNSFPCPHKIILLKDSWYFFTKFTTKVLFPLPLLPKTHILSEFSKSLSLGHNSIVSFSCSVVIYSINTSVKSDDSLLRNLKTDCPLFFPEPCIYQYWKLVTTCFSASTTNVESIAPAIYILIGLGSASLNLN